MSPAGIGLIGRSVLQRIAASVCLLLFCSCVRQGDLARRVRLSYSDSDAPEGALADEVAPADFRGKSGTAARVAAVSYYEQRAGRLRWRVQWVHVLASGVLGGSSPSSGDAQVEMPADVTQAMALLRETIGAPGMQTKEVMAACTMAAVGTDLMQPAFDRWVRLDPDNALPYYLLAHHHCLAGTPEKACEAVIAGNGKPECRYYPALHLLAQAGLVSPEEIEDTPLAHPALHPWFRTVVHQFRDQRFGTSNESKRQCAAALIAYGDKVSEMKPESTLLFLTGSAIALCAVHPDDPREWLTPALKAKLAIRRELCDEFKTWFLAAYEKGEVNGPEERNLLAELCRRRRALAAQGR